MRRLLIIAGLTLWATGAAAQPAGEAEALGRRLAEAGDFQAIIAAAAAGEIDGLAAKHDELSTDERAKLVAAARAEFQRGRAALLQRVAPIYAQKFTVEELRGIVAFFESDAGRAYTGRLLSVIPAVAKAVEGYDFKKEATAAYCRDSGKLCEVAK